ncbi:MAG: hypothetical protein LBQ31_02250 [Bacteroidales bacterium]|jgi:hypothetical protein|nr:hypothetical protein [Bacteroidales bacterium]
MKIAYASYEQAMEMFHHLSEQDRKKFASKVIDLLQSETVGQEKNELTLTDFQKLLLSAPTWTDEEYDEYLDRRGHFSKWRS